MVRFPDDIDAALFQDALESEGVFGSLSASSARVSFQKIPRIVEIPVADIDRNMDPGDPRLDPFLRNVGRLFQSGDQSVAYLPADRSLAAYRRILRSQPILSRAEIMDDNARITVQATLAFLIAAGVIRLFGSEGSTNLTLAALPWLTIVVLAGGETLFPVLVSYCIVVLRHSGARNAVWCLFAAGVIIAFAVLFFTPAMTVMFILAFVISEVVPRRLKFREPVRREKSAMSMRLPSWRREHVLFKPLTLAPSSRRNVKASGGSLSMWKPAAVVTILILSAFYPGPADHDPIPAGGTVMGPFDSMSVLHRLSGNRTADRLPDLSDLVSSAAYQEGFMNGAHYSLPILGESLTRREYRGLETAVAVEDETVVTYDEEWFNDTVNRALRRGVGQLYASLGGVASVKTLTRPESRVVKRSLDFTAYVLIVLAMLLAVLPRFVQWMREAVSSGAYPSLSTLRRRAKAA